MIESIMIQYDVCIRLCLVSLREGEEIGVALVRDGHDTKASISIAAKIGRSNHVPNTEELSGSGTERNVGTSKVVDGGLGQHCVVLELRLAEWRAVTRDQNELCWRRRQAHKRERANMSHIVSTRDLLSLTLQSPEREL